MSKYKNSRDLCVRDNVFNTMDNYVDDITSRFERILGNFFNRDTNVVSQMLSNSSFPKVNIYSRKDNGDYFFEIALPGRTKEDVEISLENGYLVIEGKSIASNSPITIIENEEINNDDLVHHYNEIVKTSFKRVFGEFPPDIYDTENIHAKMINGILYIHLPKLQKTEKKEEKKILEIE